VLTQVKLIGVFVVCAGVQWTTRAGCRAASVRMLHTALKNSWQMHLCNLSGYEARSIALQFLHWLTVLTRRSSISNISSVGLTLYYFVLLWICCTTNRQLKRPLSVFDLDSDL